jgi:hypothetical protein
MQIPSSRSVALSMMVYTSSCLCNTWHPHINFHCTWLNFYWRLHSCLKYCFFLCNLWDACALTNHFSTPSSSSNFSMFIRFIDVVHGFTCTLELWPLLHLCKNSTTNVLNLYISWIIVCTNCIFSLYVFPFSHSKDDGEFQWWPYCQRLNV